MIPTGIVGVVTYRMATTLIVEQKVNDITNKMEKVVLEVNEKISKKETMGIQFYLDDYVQDLLIHDEKSQNTYFQVMRLLFSNEYTDVNDPIVLCDKNEEIYTNSMISHTEAKKLLENGKARLETTGQNYEWFDGVEIDNMRIIPFIREIDDLCEIDHEDKGYFITGIQEELLRDIYDSYFGDEKGKIFIVSSDKQILSSDDADLIGKDFLKTFELSEKVATDTIYYEGKIAGENFYVITMDDVRRDWSYVYLLKRTDALNGMESIRLVPVWGMIISFIISVLMSVIASAQIVRPIKELTNTIQEVEKGNMTIRFQLPVIKELAELGKFFNKMMQRLEDSIQQIYVVQKQRRDAEMKALVLQINPHFLYNTLSSIIWLSNADKKDEVIEMTSSLATLFRISISKGQEIVTIREEIEHVKSYIRIQQIRFENKFKSYIELDDDIAECYTLKVILQPLVENIINHAFSDMYDQGIIIIKAEKEKDIIRFSVIDNADGMTEEEVKALNDHLQESYVTGKEYGIGTSNVNNRVKLLFGKEYGLFFRKEGINTIAEITIPVVYDETELEG